MRRSTVGALAFGALGIAGAASLVACAEQRVAARPETAAQRTGEDFGARIRQISREYRNWARVSDLEQWAPAERWAPPTRNIRMSQADDFADHGRKLFYLHAQNHNAYARLTWGETDGTFITTSPLGQAVVMESWFAEPVKGALVPFAGYGIDRRANDRTRGPDGREYRTGARGDLFVMFKVDPLTPGTDNGWVYGTVTPEGRVTSAGAVASCMECHSRAPYERLFGAK
jgi:hypothetical protein